MLEQRFVSEDTFGVLEEANTFVVADGCGSTTSGENAAMLTVSCFREVLGEPPAGYAHLAGADPLAVAVIRANEAVFKEGQANPARRGQNAALCALRVFRDWIGIVHVGDCCVGRYSTEPSRRS